MKTLLVSMVFAFAMGSTSAESLKPMRVSGTIGQEWKFNFEAYTKFGIDEQCYQFYYKHVDKPVKHIEATYNESIHLSLFNTDSYWRSVYEVCQRILSVVR